jgi:hypothetical protein
MRIDPKRNEPKRSTERNQMSALIATTIPPPGQHGPHTAKLIAALYNRAAEGARVGRSELTEVCGRDVRIPPGYGNLQSARKHLETVYGYVWTTVRGADELVCSTNAEKLGSLHGFRKQAHRLAGRTLRRCAAVNAEALDTEQQGSFLTHLATFGTLRMLTDPRLFKRIKADSPAGPALPREEDLRQCFRPPTT